MRKQIIEILSEICPGVDFETETALIDDGAYRLRLGSRMAEEARSDALERIVAAGYDLVKEK